MGIPQLAIIQMVLHAIIFIFGLMANLLLVLVIGRREKVKTATNWLVVHLAVSDLVIILITLPLTNIIPFTSWPFGEFGCKFLVMPTLETFAGVCVLTHAGVALMRYYLVSRPLNATIGKRRASIIILLIWLIPYLVMSVTLMGILGRGKFYVTRSGVKRCKLLFWNRASRIIYHILVFSLTYTIPMIATGFAYIRIHLQVQKNMRGIGDHLNRRMLIQREKQSRKMNQAFTVMYMFFGLTTLPAQLLPFFHLAGLVTSNGPIIFILLLALFYGQVLSNPAVLFYMSRKYRNELAKLVGCRKKRKISRGETMTLQERSVS